MATPELPRPSGPWCLRGSGVVAPSAPVPCGSGTLPRRSSAALRLTDQTLAPYIAATGGGPAVAVGQLGHVGYQLGRLVDGEVDADHTDEHAEAPQRLAAVGHHARPVVDRFD